MVKIQRKSNGQFVVTIDKSLGEAMDLEGESATWEVDSKHALRLRIDR